MYTYAILQISHNAWTEIRERLMEAGYQHAFHEESHGADRELPPEVIDMHGITLQSLPPDPPAEPPLLQCVTCRNTESPAGAMARQFNHGRCLHCGGYFKVVRA